MPDRYALLIGASQFDDARLPTLTAPDDDVFDLRNVLRDPLIGSFGCRVLLNAGLDETRRAISDLFGGKTRDDVLLLYYTGHGLRDSGGDLYLALSRTDAAEPSAASLEADYVRRHMDRSFSKRQVVILDCCHAGAFREGAKASPSAPMLYKSDFDPQGHGRYVLAATSAGQSAFEVNGRSVFTKYLVEGLKDGSAGSAEREFVTVNDLHNYANEHVGREQRPMQPELWADGQTSPIIVAYKPKVVVAEPSPIATALQEPPLRSLPTGTPEERIIETTAAGVSDVSIRPTASIQHSYAKELTWIGLLGALIPTTIWILNGAWLCAIMFIEMNSAADSTGGSGFFEYASKDLTNYAESLWGLSASYLVLMLCWLGWTGFRKFQVLSHQKDTTKMQILFMLIVSSGIFHAMVVMSAVNGVGGTVLVLSLITSVGAYVPALLFPHAYRTIALL